MAGKGQTRRKGDLKTEKIEKLQEALSRSTQAHTHAVPGMPCTATVSADTACGEVERGLVVTLLGACLSAMVESWYTAVGANIPFYHHLRSHKEARSGAGANRPSFILENAV